MPRRAKTIDLLRVVDLLQEHITPALCRTVFGAVRKTERQRAWTLEALNHRHGAGLAVPDAEGISHVLQRFLPCYCCSEKGLFVEVSG